ncbi:hypothetical protein D3C83_307140 [compost metagenome]
MNTDIMAPSAAESVGDAMPVKMPPMTTTKIRNSGKTYLTIGIHRSASEYSATS